MWPFGKSAKQRLEEALADQRLTADLGLKVEVQNKTAKVTGKVPNERYSDLVRAIASGINGINDVDVSGLEVAQATAAAPGQEELGSGVTSGGLGAADPSALAKAALAAIKKEPRLADDPVDVLQKGTTVVLRGAVGSDAELELIRQVVANVPSVTQVDDTGLQVVEHAAQLNDTDEDGDVVYTVKAGDTLSHIALRYYGSAGRSSYMRIAEANGLADPNKIRVGQKLKIPGTPQGPDAALA